ncbi:carbohydrate-binding protein [Cohnella terricola]|uniref:Carbohydrate-binding protein n=1 Tax=Cohnella terricola TaxID=1289167 RepID=A0A559JMU2_9BACL|nr:carbohydrate-binding protein [Cohnella terricola]TVY01178.1 carbohydrate-binding protein [Cohnella terricola]
MMFYRFQAGRGAIAILALVAILIAGSLSLAPARALAASAFTQTAASGFTSQSGIQLEASSEGGQNVAFIDNGDYIAFAGMDFGSGASSFQARVASNAGGGNIEIRLDSLNGTLIGTCVVPGTGGWQNWTTVSCGITGNPSGTHTLYLKFTGGAGNLFNVLWFKFGGASGLSAFTQIEAASYSAQSGIQTEASSEGGQNVGFIDNGDYLVFNGVDFGSGASSMQARVASNASGGNIEIRLDSLNGTLAGTCVVPGTGGWQNWTTVTCAVSNAAGVHDLYLKFTGGTGNLFNLKWFKFGASAPPTGGDVVGKLFAGYQGWFNASGDGSPNGGWIHWSKNSSAPTAGSNVNFELYPDLREYSKLYQTNLANLGNGTQAKLFSSYNQETVNKHFEWMRTYNIDGAALQRFGADESDAPNNWRTNRDSVAVKVKNAAEAYDRKFYVMYDITGMNASNWAKAVKHDWTTNVVNAMHLTSSSAYAKQNGKLVVCIWGIGFTDRPGTAAEHADLISWFKNQGIYVIGGVPTYWRTGNNDSKPGFQSVYDSLDMLSPWFVGRFGKLADADSFKTNQWAPDFAYTQQRNIAYQPVIWPGFAWSNMTGGPKNEIPRVHGDFMWRQAYNMKTLGISTGYVAMFDEYDEGTAIAKAAENSSMIPTNQYFLALDADGVAVSSDFYLRLTGDINRMFKGEIPTTANHPTSHQ